MPTNDQNGGAIVLEFLCAVCHRTYPLSGLAYRCDCGGLFDLQGDVHPIPCRVSLGESKTPMVTRTIDGVRLLLKLDFLMPTGSFKDRGAHRMINHLHDLGVREIVEDSSGNAGAAIAGYCAAAGIKAHIYLPAATSAGKTKQIEAYGATIHRIPGNRDCAAAAAKKAARHLYYASHVYNPLFFAGVKQIAQEIVEEIGVPDEVVLPVGNGSLLLGLYAGFCDLGKLPRLIAVQAANCAPVYHRWQPTPPAFGPTVAEGIAVQQPARLEQILQAVRVSGGQVITVTEEAIGEAWTKLTQTGLYAEITSAVAVAGAIRHFAHNDDHRQIVVPLTGSGLKK